MTNCSVIMVSYHTGEVLFSSVKSVLVQQQLAELIVVDNGNPPDVLARLQQMALTEPRLKIAIGGGNVGFARGCNKGAKIATGEFLMFLSPDCLLPPEALSDMIVAFEEIPNTRLAGAWLLNPDGSDHVGARVKLLTPPKALMQVFGLSGIRSLNETPPPMPRETHAVPAVSSDCMFLRTSDYKRLNGLDEAFFLHGEDMDLCVRIYKAGGKVVCIPRVKIVHMMSKSAKTSLRRVEWQRAKSFIYYFNKHFRGEYMPGVVWLADGAVLLRAILRIVFGTMARQLRREPVMEHSVAAKRLMILASGLSDLPPSEEFAGKTVLVTGATGQVGLCVVRRLLAAGAAVLAISRAEAIPFQHKHLRWIKGDLTDEKLHLHGYLVDMVIHCAPLWHLPPTIGLLADAEVKRIVVFGSTSVFGKALSGNAYEKDIVEKLTKAEAITAEQCKARNIRWTVLRPTMIYGVGLDLNVTTLAKLIRRFGFFPVYPPAFGKRQPVHADDLALAALLAAKNEITFDKAYNVSGGEVVMYRQMLERLFMLNRKKIRIRETTVLPFALDVAGFFSRKKHINGEIARRMNDDLVFFHDDAARDFGFHPRAFLSGGIKDIEGF